MVRALLFIILIALLSGCSTLQKVRVVEKKVVVTVKAAAPPDLLNYMPTLPPPRFTAIPKRCAPNVFMGIKKEEMFILMEGMEERRSQIKRWEAFYGN